MFFVLSLSACSLFTKKVYVPVATCPAPKEISKPEIPISSLTNEDKDDPKKVSKSYVITIKTLQQHIDELTAIIEGYKPTDKK